jgi:glycosyltransferase involved in cell wall biosynthesis
MVLLLLVFLMYLIFIFIPIFGFLKSDTTIYSSKKKVNRNSVTLIIPFRNEQNRISKLLEAIQRQNDFSLINKVVFVDDHSTDNSVEIIKTWILEQQHSFEIISLKSYYGKKRAIDLGVNYADSKFLMILDADISFNNSFFKNLGFLLKTECDLYLFQVVENSGLFFSKIISYVLSIITIGMANIKRPILSNGAALVFKKKSYLETNPFSDNFHVSSGDDISILNSFKNNNRLINTAMNSNLIVFTEGAETFRSLIKRSLRWSSKMKVFALTTTNIVAFLFLLCNLLVWPLAIYAMVYSDTEFLLLLAIKFFADVIILTLASFNFKDYSLIKYSLPMFVFYPIILLVVLFFNAVNYDLKWKERTVVKR